MTSPLEQDIIRVTDATTRAEIIEAIVNLNTYAKRCIKASGLPAYETPYDRAHRRINVLVTELQLKGEEA